MSGVAGEFGGEHGDEAVYQEWKASNESVAGRVLPRLRVPKGMKHLKDPRDLLTPEQHAELQKHLSEMARLRRRVETESAWIPMH